MQKNIDSNALKCSYLSIERWEKIMDIRFYFYEIMIIHITYFFNHFYGFCLKRITKGLFKCSILTI